MSNDLAFEPAWKQAELVASGDISPVELTEMYLRRIDELDPKLNAFITVASDQALDAARKAEAAAGSGAELPPLYGVPIAIKDLEMTAGLRSTLGSPALADYVPDDDSVVVERVRRSGAIILGKTNTPEIGISFKTVTDSPLAGFCHNPWDTDRTTGGSSGGSGAAVVAGLCALATGSDGGGSVRIPASFCGVFGFKPTHGRIPRACGYGNPEPNQFAQSGPMTRNVRDGALLLQALSGPDERDPNSMRHSEAPDLLSDLDRPPDRLRIGWSPDFDYGVVDPEVAATAAKAARVFEDLGHTIEQIELGLTADLADHFWNIFAANAYAAFGHLLDDPAVELGPDGVEALSMGRAVTGSAYASSLRAVEELRQRMAAVMERYDLIASPTTSVTAFDPDSPPTHAGGRQFEGVYGFYPFTYIFNMTGQPAASLPCGFVDGLPVGLQLAGRFADDGLVLRASAAFEHAAPWADRRPPVA